MRLTHGKRHLQALLLFGGVFLIYLALSPGAVGSMGYISEEVTAGNQIIFNVSAWIHGKAFTPIGWPRHGLLPVLFDLPFLAIGAFMRGKLNQDWAMSFQPVLFSALLVLVLFFWLRRFASPGWSYLLSLVAAYGTMIWPYAYIGLEVKQSLALMVAGYLAFSPEHKDTWPRVLLFAATCALAVSLKATGTFLIPAVIFIIGRVYWRGFWKERREYLPKVVVTFSIILAVYLANYSLRSLFFTPFGGQWPFFKALLVHDSTQCLLNALGCFGSVNKGLIVYAPILLIALPAFFHMPREHRPLAIFALLTLGGLVGGISPQRPYLEETWGPRYLHTAIAPLILCIGATRPRLRAATAAPALALAALGFWVSFLGAFFWYGVSDTAAQKASQSTLEAVQGDIVWNPVLFHERLFATYLRGTPTSWTPDHRWWYVKPPDAPSEKSVDLTQLAVPQPFLIRQASVPLQGDLRLLWHFYLLCLPAGVLLLVGARKPGETEPSALPSQPNAPTGIGET